MNSQGTEGFMERMLSIKSLFLFATLALASSCSQTEQIVQAENGKPGIFDVNMYSLNKLVCDPFGGGGSNIDTGIKASLYYLNDNQPRYNQVSDYINYGQRADQFIFFSQINVPTRRFDTGFPLETGGTIKVDKGSGTPEALYEYFAIRYSTVISLGPDDDEGEYELALLSDDGAVWKIRGSDGNYEVAVNNDGDHPTKMGCSTYRLNMTRSTQKLVQLDYYQGPRFHISVIPMWRKVQPGQVSPDPQCGQSGNNMYFDEFTSQPKSAYNGLLARGWKPLNAANYSLPESAIFNPCAEGINPVITNFVVEDNYDGVVIARWTTDIPATSQVRFVEAGSSSEALTESDNILRTEHEVYVNMLKPGLTYTFQGVSISDTYGKAISSPVTLQLQ